MSGELSTGRRTYGTETKGQGAAALNGAACEGGAVVADARLPAEATAHSQLADSASRSRWSVEPMEDADFALCLRRYENVQHTIGD